MADLIAPTSSSLSRTNASPEQNAGHDRGVEGRGRRSPERPVLRIPPQRGHLVTLCLDVQAPARLLQVGRDGRNRVASHPAGPLPLRLDTDRTGYVDIPHSLRRPKLLMTEDVNTIRATNNAIFNDLFWVHLAYVTAEDGIERLRALLQAERHYAPVLAGFEAIDQGRRVLEDEIASAEARQRADDLIWEGNVELLEHEQRALVQPNFDRLSCASAWLVSIGSATSFEVRGVRQEIADFTSFYLYSFTRGIPHALRARAWPRITRFDDRWRWLATSVVPRFRRFDADTRFVDASMRHILNEARDFASSPCVLPRSPADGPRRAAQPRLWHRPR